MICLPNHKPFILNCGIEKNYASILENNIRKFTDRDISQERQNLLK